MDLPPNLINPLHSYSDIDKIIVENWPAREAMIRAEGADPSRFKRLLGLTWAHTKSRRPVRTVDIEEEHSRVEDAGKGDKSTVLDNIRMSMSEMSNPARNIVMAVKSGVAQRRDAELMYS